MNKRILFISAALLLAFGCAKETGVPEGNDVFKVGVSLSDVRTRTYLDEALSDGKRQVCWSEGDAVNLNGYPSLALTAEQAGKPEADFLFYNGTAPFSIIYPASICQGSEYAEDGTLTVNIPSVQEYSATSFGKGAAVLYGYGESHPVTLNNLCGAVRVTVKGQETVIRRASLISNDPAAAVAGKYSINPRTGEYAVLDGIRSISLDITEITLGTDGQSFYFTLPYGEYPEGFTVKFYNAEDYPMECVWLKNGQDAEGVTIEAGHLYEFKPVDFAAGKKEILTGTDWNYIATQINEGKEDWKAVYLDGNTINFGADITLDKDAVQIETLEYVIDGNGFSITSHEAGKPLVKTLPKGGEIRNLTIAGEMIADGADVSVFVHTVSGGTVEDCVNEMDIEVSTKNPVFGAFVRTMTAGMLKGCVNKGDITVNLVNETGTSISKSFGGGLVATCFNPTDVSTIEDCVNEGDVKIILHIGNYLGVQRAGYGGIIGYVSGADADKTCRIIGCENYGKVSLDVAQQPASMPLIQYSVGGILGLSSALTKSADSGGKGVDHAASKIADPLSSSTANSCIRIEKCSNFAEVSNGLTSRSASTDIFTKIFTGGIAGTVIGCPDRHSVIKDCVSSGAVIPYSVKVNPYSRAALCGVCGGVVGLGGHIDIEGGSVTAEVGTPDAFSFSVGGVIGTAAAGFSISGMTIRPKISMVQCDDQTKDNYALAVVNSTSKLGSTTDISGSTITGCSFGGSFFTASAAKYTDAAPYPERIVAVTAEDVSTGRYIMSASYTKGDVTLSDNIFAEAD